MKYILRILRYNLALLICILLCPSSALAFVSFVYMEVGEDVVLTASGGYENLNGLAIGTSAGSGTESGLNSSSPSLHIYSGASTSPINFVTGYTLNRINDANISSNSSAGFNWATSSAITGTGPFYVEINNSSGSVSSLALAYDFDTQAIATSITYSGTSTWNSTTLAGLGLATGSYEIRWDSGKEGINISVVPEPSAFAPVASLFALGLVVCRRNRK